ncbi:trypsin-like peptidase domain-containing protein [Streptomyces sp. JJ66]|uniref:S1C family serine protease n=1 Tax=Streptomyces sp. JJ66 TaxID=2803843 RepID=UPI001C578995|nr:trypsin-like peptidase domain-containing protein [Streptomyces sp. JJ66]MBW1602952.1 trypsin-like peptidase domain-containing protein [Streptomyces sp. JJ66]
MDEAEPTASGTQREWWSRPGPPPGPQAASTPPPARSAEAAQPSAPLHGEDVYATPPYGDPGPWSPAPPVQHPGGTPASGTPAPGTSAPEPAGSATPAAPTSAPRPGAAQPSAPQPGLPQPGPPQPGPPQAAGPPSAYAVPPVPAPAPAPVAGPAAPSTLAEAPPSASWSGYDPWAQPQPVAPAASGGQRKGPRPGRLLAAALVLALIAGLGGGLLGAYLERQGLFGTVTLPQASGEELQRPAGSVAGIADATLPGVVTLHVQGPAESGTGTGFVLDDKGHILTNDHVVAPAREDGRIQVTFHSGETAAATLVGGDTGYDLAVVKVDGVVNLNPLPLGDSDPVKVGDPVVAIGAPFDLAGTVTSGIISAKERPIVAGGQNSASDVSYVNALQTDAAINPGNSGGPLVDAEGRVIGVNSAIRSAGGSPDSQGGSIGLGFAIPVNQAKRVAEELINTGRATHPVIGVRVDMTYAGNGARIGSSEGEEPGVVPGGPADDAGLRDGDVVTAVDGEAVRNGEELIVRIRSHRPGDVLDLTIERDGSERTLAVTLGSAS